MPDRTVAPTFKKLQRIQIPRVTSSRLQNGILLNYINAGTQPVCKIELIFLTGKVHEAKPGISYLTFKMLQEGTRSLSSFQIAEKIELTGSYLGIEPGIEHSTIELYFLKNKGSIVIPLLKELFFESTFPEEELKKVKQILSQNLKIELEKTSVVASRLFRKKLFGEMNPYGSFLEPDLISQITQEDLIDFYQTKITQVSLEIIASGLIDAEILELLEKNFGERRLNKMGTDNSFEILTDPSREFIEKKSSSQTSIRIGKFCAKKQDVDFHKLFITNEILGGYFGSRLMQNIRENKGLTYGIYSNIVTTLSNGYIVISADAKKELHDKVIEEVFEEIDLLTTKGVSEEELSTVRNYLFGEFLGDVNTPFNLADKFKSVHLHGLGYEFYDEYFEVLESITSQEIQETAQKYLDKSGMAVIGVG